MIWNLFRRRKPSSSGQAIIAGNAQQVIDLIDELISASLILEGKRLGEFFSTLMTNRLAAGYVFGFHDCCFQMYGLINRNDSAPGMALIEKSYEHIFGEQAGFTLFRSSTMWQEDRDFVIGRQSGGEDFAEFRKNGTPTLGLQRIISLGFNADMVERGLSSGP